MIKPEFTGQVKRDYKLAVKRECHIEPDWLLVYKIVNETLILKEIAFYIASIYHYGLKKGNPSSHFMAFGIPSLLKNYL